MSLILAMAALAAPQAAPRAVPLQPTGAAADARCVVVFGAIGAQGRPEQVATARQGIFYFLGKLRGRDPRADIPAIIRRSAAEASASGANARAEAQRCLNEARAAGAALAGLRPGGAPKAAPKAGR